MLTIKEMEVLGKATAMVLKPLLDKTKSELGDHLELIQDLQDRVTALELITQGQALRLDELKAKQ